MRTSAYKFSFNVGDLESIQALTDIRKTITDFNKLKVMKYNAYTKAYTAVKYRVCVKARLGKANPLWDKYKRMGVHSVAMVDARYYDVYVQTRYL